MPIRFSIITPSYQQGRYIEETIRSVHSQDYPQVDHFVVDGGSSDGTLEILKRHEHRLRWISEPDGGQAAAINKGFKQATGDIVTWINSDDVYLPGALQRVAEFFGRRPDVDVVYGDYHLIDQDGTIVLSKKEIPFDRDILLYGLDYISQPTTFFRRRVFEKVGYLDETLNYGLDWEYWLRMAAAGLSFGHLPHYLAATRWHSEAKTIDAPVEMYAEHEIIRDRYWDRRRFHAPAWHRRHAVWLSRWYRLKRQWLKVVLRRTLDFPPGDWVLRGHGR